MCLIIHLHCDINPGDTTSRKFKIRPTLARLLSLLIYKRRWSAKNNGGREINKQRRNKAEAAAIQPKGTRAEGGSEAEAGGGAGGAGAAVVEAHRCNKVHRAGRIKRSSITTWGPGAAYFIRPRELGCGILFRALGMLSTAKNFHKTAICHLRRHSSLSPCLRSFSLRLCLMQFLSGSATSILAFLPFLACPL